MAYIELITKRLRFAPIRPSDVDRLHEILVAPAVRRYLLDGVAISRETVDEWVATSSRMFDERGCGLWSLRSEAGDIVGLAGFWTFHEQLELLYALDPNAWGNGYATEAARALIRFGLEALGFDRVVASTDAPNAASVGVMRRAGMVFLRRATIDGRETIFYAVDRDRSDTFADGEAYRVVRTEA